MCLTNRLPPPYLLQVKMRRHCMKIYWQAKCNHFVMLLVTLVYHPLTLTTQNTMKTVLWIITNTSHCHPCHCPSCHHQVMGNRATSSLQRCKQSTILKVIIWIRIVTLTKITQRLTVMVIKDESFLLQRRNCLELILYFLNHIITLQNKHLLLHHHHHHHQ